MNLISFKLYQKMTAEAARIAWVFGGVRRIVGRISLGVGKDGIRKSFTHLLISFLLWKVWLFSTELKLPISPAQVLSVLPITFPQSLLIPLSVEGMACTLKKGCWTVHHSIKFTVKRNPKCFSVWLHVCIVYALYTMYTHTHHKNSWPGKYGAC